MVRGDTINTTSGVRVRRGMDLFVTGALHGFKDTSQVRHSAHLVNVGNVAERSSEVLDRVLWSLEDGINYDNDALDLVVITEIKSGCKSGGVVFSGFPSGRLVGAVIGTRILADDTSDDKASYLVISTATEPADGICGAPILQGSQCVGIYRYYLPPQTDDDDDEHVSLAVAAQSYFNDLQLA